MTSRAAPEAPRRGRPRSERAQEAILRAASELLQEQGLRTMSMDAVAERAGVSKATIYRWWPSKGVLALDAFYAEWSHVRGLTPNTGSLAGDLRTRMRTAVRFMTSRRGRVLRTLIAEVQCDEQLAEGYRAHVLGPLRQQSVDIFRRAIDRGEIPPDTPVDVVNDLLYGPLFQRLLLRHAPLDRRFADQVVDLVLAAVGAVPPSAE
jgi:AcrR family transcriptional regulator